MQQKPKAFTLSRATIQLTIRFRGGHILDAIFLLFRISFMSATAVLYVLLWHDIMGYFVFFSMILMSGFMAENYCNTMA
jgi:hypothetical protein